MNWGDDQNFKTAVYFFVLGRDLDWMSCVEKANPVGPTMVDSNHLLYILYTSGTTAAPKGVMRDTGGYATALSYIQDEK